MKNNKQDIDNKELIVNYTITSEGSLGLLAIGDIGLRAWRKVKKTANKNLNNSSEEK